MAIIRLTFGYRKSEAKIKNKQLSEITGIYKTHVSNVVRILVKKQIVTQTGNFLCLNKNTDVWISLEKLPKQVTIKKEKKLPKQVTKVTQTGNLHIYKENIKEKRSISSNMGHVPCTRQEILEICKLTGCSISYAHKKHEAILDKIAEGTLNKKKNKTVYYTLKKWVTMFPQDGYKRTEFENLTFEIDAERYLKGDYYLG